MSKGKGEVVELGGDEGVEEGNGLKKHYVTKECMMAQSLRGQGLNERKGVLLEQIWVPGRRMEGVFYPSGQSGFMGLFDLYFGV